MANNGGLTSTQLPASSSPAGGAVPPSVASGAGDDQIEQRGDARGQGAYGYSTIGSVEVARATPSPPTTPTTTSPTSSMYGYWLVGSDGGIFTFGSAHFYGSTGSIPVAATGRRASCPTANNAGYWLVGSDGGVFAFGNAGYYGSIPGASLAPQDVRPAAAASTPRSSASFRPPTAVGTSWWPPTVAYLASVMPRFAGSLPGDWRLRGARGWRSCRTPPGNGYWVVTQTGQRLRRSGTRPTVPAPPGPQGVPVTSAVRTADGGGYLDPSGRTAPSMPTTGTRALCGGPQRDCIGGLERGLRRPSSPTLRRRRATGWRRSDGAGRPLRRRPQRGIDGGKPPQRLDHRRHRFLTAR